MAFRHRHEVDPTIQASMLPPAAGQLATSAVVELEGGYYQAPDPGSKPELTLVPQLISATSETLNPEQQRVMRLQTEDVALDYLGRAAETNKKITHMTNARRGLLHRGVNQGEQARLARTVVTSEETRKDFRRTAKKHFALSLGIETEEVTDNRVVEYEGIEKQAKLVIATDPSRQAELSNRYGKFLEKYQHSEKQRDARRAEIATQLAAAPAITHVA